jgi:hypothetical protein
VAVQILRDALHGQVDAHRQRLLVDRGRKRIVDHRQHAPRAARIGKLADIDAAQRRIDGRLEPDDPRPVAEERFHMRELVERHEPRRDPESAEDVLEQVQRSAVNGRAAHDLVPCPQVRQQNSRRRGLTRCEHQGALGAIERGELLLRRDDGRVRVARIQMLRRSAFVVGHHFLGVVEDERGRFVNRCGQRRDRRSIDRLARVDQVRRKAVVRRFHVSFHKPTFSPDAPTIGSTN